MIHIETEYIWHDRKTWMGLLGWCFRGFSYGDRLRAGDCSHSPIIHQVKKIAKDGVPVLGICNGFQILIESVYFPVRW
jgi:phosphoribosylformylglycinamidine synthase